MANREYHMEDDILLQRSRTLRQHFLNNLTDFTNFDPDFDNTYAADWQAQIEESENVPTDQVMNADVTDRTRQCEGAVKLCMDTVTAFEVWVKKAFPNQPLVMREFGFNLREKVRYDNMKTVKWMMLMQLMADYYEPELSGVGMPPSVLTDMKDAMLDLFLKEIEQEFSKRLCITALRMRLLAFNRLYQYATDVRGVAQAAFPNDEEKRNLFNVT